MNYRVSNKKKAPSILVLLIGEVLEDPRVYKTCLSLTQSGADVTVACTNPSRRSERETYSGMSIIRFPHREDYFLKKLYLWLQGCLHPGAGRILSHVHEEVPKSSFKAAMRNYILDLNFTHFMKSNLKINRMMIKAFTGKSFDLVHCNDFDTLFAGNELRRTGIAGTLLYDSHEFWPGLGVYGSRTNNSIREAEAVGIKNADFVVTVNPLMADLIREEYGLKETPSAVMNCPYRYEGKLYVDEVHSPVRIIYQGKLQAFRGLPELVLAFKHISNGVLTLSGFGPQKEQLINLVKKEKLTDRVVFAGRYEPLAALKILLEHDIGVMPYKDVNLNNRYISPNKVFDYAMAGLAVTVSNLPFVAGTVLENDMGRLFESVDPGSISETLNSMISDTGRLMQYKNNARKAAVETFCWEEQFWKNYPWHP